ncbi:hypothetical protein GCM10022243_45510 [Saccharothrix violaceirubra]|uniref:Uncharacterized protein n=1 Tax=Saccharothrix violaceirubra TaxID=413306 RepID=A0A7W7T0Y1_9PSEU|nr:hypothetical protein [Saccharothrix violaceirubra]MBB4964559.1 hypothetical protein [Saccharothrix violaceirubra]
MPFFDVPERKQGFEELTAWDPSSRSAPREWVLPATVPWTARLGEGRSAVVVLDQVRCWREGVEFTLLAFRRRVPFSGNRLSIEATLRFGVGFADGRRATTVDPWDLPDDRPALVPQGGGGSQFHQRKDYYLTPMPPAGPLTLVVAWPDGDIPETATVFDAAELRDASDRAVAIWPDLVPPSP